MCNLLTHLLSAEDIDLVGVGVVLGVSEGAFLYAPNDLQIPIRTRSTVTVR